jgi:hypothetical protein
LNEQDHWKTIIPEQLDLITYPYEWCFSQWKQAALLTLEIMKVSIAHGMILKDATPFNIQFRYCKPVFIDTLSFEFYNEKEPWIAYRQFCESFLAPLVIMSYVDTSLHKLLMIYPAGIPLKIASKMLPFRTRFNSGLLMHIFLQASVSEKQIANKNYRQSFSKHKLLAIINSLESTIAKLVPLKRKTKWNNYYRETILSKEYVTEKEAIVRQLLSYIKSNKILDLGGNNGHFSKIATGFSERVIMLDSDERSVDHFYLDQSKVESKCDAMVADIAAPSPALGILLQERESLLNRVKADTVLALGILHHMIISDQFTFDQAAKLFVLLGENILLEFPLPDDPKVTLISTHINELSVRYSIDLFKKAFEPYFSFEQMKELKTAKRVIFLLKRKHNTNK